MNQLTQLHATLRAAASLLDSAAEQVRDAALQPTRMHIESIGQALANIYDIQSAIYKLQPELEPTHDQSPEEVQAANHRLGNALIAAYGLTDEGHTQQAVEALESFITSEPSTLHQELAGRVQKRLTANDGM